MARVKFHRQGDKLEQRHQPKQQNADVHQQGVVKQQPDEKDRNGKGRPNIGNGDNGAAQLQRAVFLGVLHGMAAFVRRHPYGRDGGAAIHPLRKVHDIGAGVVVIGQLPAYLVHLHIAQPVVVQDLPCDLRRRAASHAAHLGIFGIGGLYPELRP